jgi:LacI family transcriptional regulator
MNPDQNPTRKILVASTTAPAGYYRGIGRFAREHDWHLVMDTVYTGTVPGSWHGDGVLIAPGYNRALHALIRSSGLPCVALSSTNERLRVPRVESDHGLIGRLAAEHFLERGYQHFAWAPFTDDAANHERHAGFRQRLAEDGFTCRVLPPVHARIAPDWGQHWRERRERLVAEVVRLPRPTAIFAGNDCVATDIIDSCRDAGLIVPDHLAVLGVDNEPAVCEGSSVLLSSIEHDSETMGYRAAELLESLMNGAVSPLSVIRIAPKGVAVRVSTDTLAVKNDRIAHALRHIAENFARPMLSVSGVAEAVGVSRRHLERMFRTELGCTINERIVQTRMQAAARLLKTYPEARMPDVAQSVGLNQPKNFFRAFRRFFRMSPAAYRDEREAVPWTAPSAEMEEASSRRLAVASAGGG